MKTNILFLLQTLRTGGSERLVLELCQNLDPARFNCFVTAFIDGALREKFTEMRIPTFLVAIRSARQDALNTMWRISDIIRRNKIHVVNAHHFTPFFYSFYGARRHGCKLFFTAHSRAEIAASNKGWSVLGGLMVRFSDGAIGISPDVGEAIKDQFRIGAKKVLTLTNAVNHRHFTVNGDRKARRSKLGLKENDIVIGCVGNLRKDKNYPNLIRAFKTVHERVPETKLIIAGEGKRRPDLETLVADLDLGASVLLLGARNDIPEILNVMDVYCLSSFSEGLPLSLLEAMSAGLPVIGTNVRGIKDVVEDGETGILVPSDNPGKLAVALFRMIEDRTLARELSKRGQEYVIREHGFDTWIARYEALFAVNGSKALIPSKAS